MNQKAIFQKFFPLVLVVVVSFLAVRPLFNQGFFLMHDDTQVARVFEMGKVLKTGIFPVRWVPDLGYGYGYPIFNFYAPLAYYVGGFFTLLGFDALAATKIMMLVGVLLAGITMYFLAKEFWGWVGGVVAGVAYVYIPYHALNIYVRGAVAEFYAYAFIPLVFYGLYGLYNSILKTEDIRSRIPWVLIGAIGYAGVILSHNLTAMMITPFAIAFSILLIFLSKKKLTVFYLILYTVLLAILLSAFYWLPAITEMQKTNVLSQIGGGADFRNHYVCISQLWESPWAYAGSIAGCNDGMSFRIGKAFVVIYIVAVLLFLGNLFFSNKELLTKSQIVLGLGVIIGSIFSVFLTLEYSQFIWELFSPMAFFQFPWRFLAMIAFFICFLIGGIPYLFQRLIKNKNRKTTQLVLAGIIIGVLVITNMQLFRPERILTKTNRDYVGDHSIKWVASKISDEYLPPNFKKPTKFQDVFSQPNSQSWFYKPTQIQQLSNFISLAGIFIFVAAIIYSARIGTLKK